MYSKEGPGISVGDVNADGLDDFYIGGATGSFGTFFIQQKTGSFNPRGYQIIQIMKIWDLYCSMQMEMEMMTSML